MQINTEVVTTKKHYLELSNHELLVINNALYFASRDNSEDRCWETKDEQTGETQGSVLTRLREAVSAAYNGF
jgi:hypothetical protein